ALAGDGVLRGGTRVIEVGGDLEGWDDFVRAQPAGLFSYTLAWKGLLEELLGCEPHYLVARERGEIVGVLPAMERGGILNALPFYGSCGAPLGEAAALLEAYEQLADAAGAATIVGNPLGQPDPPVRS